MEELLKLQQLQTSQDEACVCAFSWSYCNNGSCNHSAENSFGQ